MPLSKLLFNNTADTRTSIGLLVFRVVTGAALMIHGWDKIQQPFSWMSKGDVPALLQFLAAFSEFGGGLALILGLLTPIACFGIACTMAVAILMAHSGDPWIGRPRSFELAGSYLVASFLLMLAGPGKLSLDKILFGRKLGFQQGTQQGANVSVLKQSKQPLAK